MPPIPTNGNFVAALILVKPSVPITEVSFFGCSCINSAAAKVIGSICLCLQRFIRVMRRYADNGIAAQHTACNKRRQITLPQMYARRVYGKGNVRTVVNYQRHSVLIAQGLLHFKARSYKIRVSALLSRYCKSVTPALSAASSLL